jgi:hypothetical protein
MPPMCAALVTKHATAERSKEIGASLGGVIDAAPALNRSSPSAAVPEGCGIGAAWSEEARSHGSKDRAPKQGQHVEAAGGIEPPYGALQAPA